jgi:hypothetical protein
MIQPFGPPSVSGLSDARWIDRRTQYIFAGCLSVWLSVCLAGWLTWRYRPRLSRRVLALFVANGKAYQFQGWPHKTPTDVFAKSAPPSSLLVRSVPPLSCRSGLH